MKSARLQSKFVFTVGEFANGSGVQSEGGEPTEGGLPELSKELRQVTNLLCVVKMSSATSC